MPLPLYKRGWVLQERLLMTRGIIFTQDQIFFQCTNGTTRDIFPQNNFQELGLTLSSIGPRGFTYENCFQQWRLLVQAYARTALSKQSDALIAVSGLAEKVKQVRPNRYLHGLWEADLLRDLAWKDVGHERRLELDVPSWSWASVRRPYYVDRHNAREIPNVLPTTSEDELRLRGPMFSISTDTSSSESDSDRISKAISQRMEFLSVDGSAIYAPLLDSGPMLDGSEAEKEKRPVPGMLLCLPLLLHPKEPTSFLTLLVTSRAPPAEACVGLLLEPVAAARGSYRRVGLFEIEFRKREKPANLDASEGSAPEPRGRSEDCFERLMALCANLPGDIHNDEYDEATNEHTVYLV